jgi:hypothetical protein
MGGGPEKPDGIRPDCREVAVGRNGIRPDRPDVPAGQNGIRHERPEVPTVHRRFGGEETCILAGTPESVGTEPGLLAGKSVDAECADPQAGGPRYPELAAPHPWKIRASSGTGEPLGEGVDLLFLGLDEREKSFALGREPAFGGIEVIAAARLGSAVPGEEGPVLRPPVVEPEAVLGDDELAEGLRG